MFFHSLKDYIFRQRRAVQCSTRSYSFILFPELPNILSVICFFSNHDTELYFKLIFSICSIQHMPREVCCNEKMHRYALSLFHLTSRGLMESNRILRELLLSQSQMLFLSRIR